MKYLLIILLLSSCTVTKTVQLDGSKSYDPDGQITDYNWRQLTGKQSIIKNPHSVITTTIIGKGDYSWELTVTDNQGAKDKDTTKITQY